MTTQQIHPVVIDIPSLGECTLLPLGMQPESFRTYEKLLEKSILFDLTELPELTRSQIQEIFKTVAHKLSENKIEVTVGVTIWLSGAHDAYSLLNIADRDQEPEKCITFMEIFLWDEITATEKEGVYGGHVDMTLEEIPTTELWKIEGDDLVYCLFMGT